MYNVHPIRNPTTTAHDVPNNKYSMCSCFDKQNRDDMKTFFLIYLNFSVQCQQACQFFPLASWSLWERERRSNSSVWPLGILHRPSSGLKRSNTTFGFSTSMYTCSVLYSRHRMAKFLYLVCIQPPGNDTWDRWKGSWKRLSNDISCFLIWVLVLPIIALRWNLSFIS